MPRYMYFLFLLLFNIVNPLKFIAMKNIMFGTVKRSLISCAFIAAISFLVTKNPAVRVVTGKQVYEVKNFIEEIRNECRKNKNNPFLNMRRGDFYWKLFASFKISYA